MGIRPEILKALLDPMNQVKKNAIDGLRQICENKESKLESWWAWTIWLAYAITVERIQSA